MIVWPLTRSSAIVANSSTAETRLGHSADAQRRQHDQDRPARRAGTGSSRARAHAPNRAARPCTGRTGPSVDRAGRAMRAPESDGRIGHVSRNDTGPAVERRRRLATIGRWPPERTLRSPVRGIAIRLASRARADRRRRRGRVPAGRSRSSAGRPGAPGSTTSSTRRCGVRPGRRPTTPSCAETFYGADPAGARDGPGPAPTDPTPSADLLAEFTTRLAPHNLNSWHPRSLSYFTPPPLPMSIVGELLAQFTNQGVDVWHAGPIGAFVEEEVGRWLCDLVGYGPDSFGILTSGRRDGQPHGDDGRPRRPPAPDPAGLDRTAARAPSSTASVPTPRTRPTSRSPGRSTSSASRPTRSTSSRPTNASGCAGQPVAEAIAEDRAAGLRPWAISAVAGSTNTGSVDLTEELADVAEREGLWLHVDAAYGGGALLSARDRLARARASTGPTASRSTPQVVLPGLRHRWAARPAGRRPARRLPSQPRVLPRRRDDRPPSGPMAATSRSSSTSTSARSRAPAAGGRSSCG